MRTNPTPTITGKSTRVAIALTVLECLISGSVLGTGLFPGAAPLETESVPLRFEQGSQVNVAIDASDTLHKANTLVGGVAMTSLSRWCDGLMPFSMVTGEYTLPEALESAFIDMELPMTRFYAPTTEEPFDNLPDALDAIATFMDRIHIPKDLVSLELEDYYANSTYSPEEWADAVAYSIERNYGFRYWEIGNEVYQRIWGSNGQAFLTPGFYISHFNTVSLAIKAVQPDALIGLSIPRSNKAWGDGVMKSTAGNYDYVCPHFYGGFFNVHAAAFEDVVISDNHTRIDQILGVNKLLKELNPDKETFIYDTEWGLHANLYNDRGQVIDAPDFQPKNGNIMGTIYRAVRLVYYARENLVRGAAGWKSLTRLANPGFATLYYTEPERRTMLYWLYYYFNRSLQEDVSLVSGEVPYHGSYPLVPIVATTDEQKNHMTIMLVNGSWQSSFPAEIAIHGFSPILKLAVVLSHDDLDAYPHLEQKSDFVNEFPVTVTDGTLTFDLPPHSIVFIELFNGSGTVPSWAGYEVMEDGDVDTGSWMEWINVTHKPYVWSYGLQSFMYMEENEVTGSGSWGYIFK